VPAPRASVIGLILLGLGTAGCGNAADRDRVTEVTQRFFTAVGSGDGAAACDQLGTDTRKTLEDDERKPCREAIGELDLEAGDVVEAEVFATNAKADLDNGETAFLSLTPDGWRISAAGCAPGDGPPAREPMDCELEA
jgi:hypothetical protein